MNRRRGILAFAAAAFAAVAGETVSLQTPTLHAEWDAARGALVSLKDLATGREWLDPAATSPLYAIRLADSDKAISSAQAVSVSTKPEAGALTVTCVHTGLTVTCEYRVDASSPCVLGRISIRAESAVRLAEVRFPLVALKLPFSGDGSADRLLWPECDGTLLLDPGKNRPDRSFSYPGSASLQLLAAFDPAAGLSLAARDTAAHTKLFCSRRSGKGLELSVAHVLPQTPVSEWRLPYDVAVAGLTPSAGLTNITWEAAADRYRDWAVGQPWCRRTMSQRVAAGDIPKWLAEPTMLVTYSLRGERPDGSFGDRRDLLTNQVQRWSQAVGAPITTLLISWEKLDTWTTPDYFPPLGGERAFDALTRQLRAQGGRTMVFLSGLHWTLHKTLKSQTINQEAAFNSGGRPWAISDAQGVAFTNGSPDKGVGQTATLCAATPLARELLTDTSARCQRLGIDCVQIDQIVGGGMKACFHPNHAHPPGGGAWCSEALYGIFEEIRKRGKARDPDFAFSIEEPNEYYLPLLDTYHARDLHQGRWPRSGAGVLGVPLFTHVYHDYLAGYGSEGCYVSEKPSRLALYQIGMNLVCGKMPAAALWTRWCEPEKVDAAQRRLLREHLDLWRGAAAPFLNFGRRVASADLAVPALEMTFTEKDGKTKRPLTVPSVLHGTWRLDDGRTATLFACVADAPVTFAFNGQTVTLQPGEAALR
jgi:hypothetical protein